MSRDQMLRTLARLMANQAWVELRTQAIAAAAEYPDSADAPAFAAHAMRQLGELEDGYTWAARAVAIDRDNLFAINRLSLLGNLTGRFDEVYAIVQPQLDRVVTTGADAQNLAVTIVNGIHAAGRLGRIAEAVELYSPAIARLDHKEAHFNSACMYALASDDRIYTYMAKALATGKPKADFGDADFDAYRREPRFVALLARDWTAEAAALARARPRTRDELRPEDFIDPAALSAEVPDLVRNPELERAIDASVDDPGGYLVYSDWLQERADPRGWFIVLSRRCDEARTEDERMLAFVEWAAAVHEHGRRWLGAFADHLARDGRARWRHGFVRELGFDIGYGDRGDDPGALLAATLARPACRFVRALAIGDVWCREELFYDRVVDALVRAELPHLRALAIEPNDYQMSWTHLDASPLAGRFPALESLVLGAGDLTIGALDRPRLRRFALHTGGLTRDNLVAICAARWPALEDLELWFGSTEHGADDFDTGELAPILRGRGTPALRRLALMNAEFTDELCTALASAPIVAQLAELDLGMGTMTDAGAAILASNASRFAHLTRLSVADNAVSADAVAALQRALPSVHAGTQKDDRYVSVGE